jgi:hypothetical protein
MWELRRLTTLWAFTHCYRDSFTLPYLHYVSPAEINPFPKTEAFREVSRQKKWADAVLADTPVKVALLGEIEARVKPVKCIRLFSDGQWKSRTPKLKKNVQRVDVSEEDDESFCTECAKAPTKLFQCITVKPVLTESQGSRTFSAEARFPFNQGIL